MSRNVDKSAQVPTVSPRASDGRTHWEGCEEAHHDCALACLADTRRERDEARAALRVGQSTLETCVRDLGAALAERDSLHALLVEAREALEAWRWAEADKGPIIGDSQLSRNASALAIAKANAELSKKAHAMRDAVLARLDAALAGTKAAGENEAASGADQTSGYPVAQAATPAVPGPRVSEETFTAALTQATRAVITGEYADEEMSAVTIRDALLDLRDARARIAALEAVAKAAEEWRQTEREYYESDRYTRSPLTPEEEESDMPYLDRMTKAGHRFRAAVDALRRVREEA